MKNKLTLLAIAVMLCILPGCSGAVPQASTSHPKTTISFADVGWDSIKLNNALAGLVAEKVFGYTWQEVPGSTPISHEALLKGEVDVNMEEWTANVANYGRDLQDGKFREMGINFSDNAQGFYIPRYVAEQYPDLRTVKDLAKYPELFPDPEKPGKAIIYGGVAGWAITDIMGKKVKLYGLDEYYTYFPSGSDAILSAAMTSAWDRKKPIVAYYWEPTWLLGQYDFVLLKDEPYDSQRFHEGFGSCPPVKITIAVSNSFAKSNEEYCKFLARYKMSSKIISEALAYMKENRADYRQAAIWLLTKSHPELVKQWLTADQAKKLSSSM